MKDYLDRALFRSNSDVSNVDVYYSWVTERFPAKVVVVVSNRSSGWMICMAVL